MRSGGREEGSEAGIDGCVIYLAKRIVVAGIDPPATAANLLARKLSSAAPERILKRRYSDALAPDPVTSR